MERKLQKKVSLQIGERFDILAQSFWLLFEFGFCIVKVIVPVRPVPFAARQEVLSESYSCIFDFLWA
ncbi:hypothetical protein KY285_011140 [Solanum tuberosum]|nr:hypothetical protein KY289_011713 [Solanum tuberosum]KAH0735433.1 hypothetical protein KY285_011140 [Solanum tuberosum]